MTKVLGAWMILVSGMRWDTFTVFCRVAGVLVIASASAMAQDEADKLHERAKSMFGAVDESPDDQMERPIVELGHRLFWDERLSSNGKVACANCHTTSAWGADSAQFSLDAKGKRTKRNSQTVFNSMLQPNLRWTADRKSGAHQAEKSLTGSMGFARADDVLPLLTRYGYEPLFKAAFPTQPSPVTPVNYAKAIEAYEETLTTPAPFDRYLAGNRVAIDAKQKEGLRLFLDIGCADCHSGKLLGGEDVAMFGVYGDYWTLTNSQVPDEGLFESSENEADKFHFRISMLRNIDKTGPYFHDGSVSDLKAAVTIMARLQVDRELRGNQIDSIVVFLKSLTGEVPMNYQRPDALMSPR
ncbi:Cytochrome c551 peroxidase precursor [Pirellula sp. SH-Sr6A]|uniref:cytochrome-c peroxidase n=1 Tax=Pirellula sp. SH-Sr6A TaxID=1632865 RepID=UPI00078DC1A5|nr:cytochrome c peroxidase [Pirellula sp. SH-Sr6A]AMV35387.1 Cytochrome c551 peroxidase precursor [Pirellula sp. SH-Sr6A]